MQEKEKKGALDKLRRVLALFAPGLVETYDYDSHMLRRAIAYGCGTFVVLLAFSVRALCRLFPATKGSDAHAVAEWLDHIVGLLTKEFVDGTFASSHITATIALFVLLGVGAAIIVSTRKDHDAFIDANPFVKDPYDAVHTKKAVRRDWIVAGIGASVGGIGAALLVWRFITMGVRFTSVASVLVDALGFFLLAVGAFAFVTGRLAARRFNVFAYNYAALGKKSPYEIYGEHDGPERDLALQEKALQEVSRWVSSIVWGAAVIITFVLFALPTIHTPLYWVPLVIAALTLHLFNEHNLKHARRLYDASSAS